MQTMKYRMQLQDLVPVLKRTGEEKVFYGLPSQNVIPKGHGANGVGELLSTDYSSLIFSPSGWSLVEFSNPVDGKDIWNFYRNKTANLGRFRVEPDSYEPKHQIRIFIPKTAAPEADLVDLYSGPAAVFHDNKILVRMKDSEVAEAMLASIEEFSDKARKLSGPDGI